MSILLQHIFAKEFTSLPKILDNHFGSYFNNTVTNGVTWTFILWTILHIWFDSSVNMLMRRMLIKKYIRKRLVRSIWLCGFCGTSLVYCTKTILQNNFDIASYKSALASIYDNPEPNHLVVGFILLMGFFVHSLIYDLLLLEAPVNISANYSALCVLIGHAYILRRIDLYLTIVAISSFTKFITEILSIFIAFIQPKTIDKYKLLLDIILAINIIIVLSAHVVLTTVLAFFIYNHQLTFLLILWIITEFINSPVYKFANHWLNHDDGISNRKVCLGNRIECSLFQPRDDMTFCMSLVSDGIKAREEKMKALQKPKYRGILVQTLKCIGMMTVKKKIREKRIEKCVRNLDSLVNNDNDGITRNRDKSELESDGSCDESASKSDENN